ncbi:MAG: hypothetical protein ABI294_04640 [Casimicrobiaceae bacterium]
MTIPYQGTSHLATLAEYPGHGHPRELFHFHEQIRHIFANMRGVSVGCDQRDCLWAYRMKLLAASILRAGTAAEAR